MSPLNDTFKALSDPTRRQILKLLREKDLSAGEIADQFEMTKPSISHHLNLLKQADLISDRRQGQNIYYSLNTSVFEGIMGWFLEFKGKQTEGNPEEESEPLTKEKLGTKKVKEDKDKHGDRK